MSAAANSLGNETVEMVRKVTKHAPQTANTGGWIAGVLAVLYFFGINVADIQQLPIHAKESNKTLKDINGTVKGYVEQMKLLNENLQVLIVNQSQKNIDTQAQIKEQEEKIDTLLERIFFLEPPRS